MPIWILRDDAHDLLDRKLAQRTVAPELAEALRSLIDKGYAILPAAVPASLIDRYVELFDSIWKAPPFGLQRLDEAGKVAPVTAADRDRTVRVISLHLWFAEGAAIVFPPRLAQLLAAVYERPAVCFQSMSFRHGSQQALHRDTAYLPLTGDSDALTASWTALQDVAPGSGELVYFDGSHRVPAFFFAGGSKFVEDAPERHQALLDYLPKECATRALPRQTFRPRKGDVLVWLSDLIHGGAPVTDRALLRRSLVCHHMPLGSRPRFYDASRERIVPYGAAYRLERLGERSASLRRMWQRWLAP
jgi:hypothetical protein